MSEFDEDAQRIRDAMWTTERPGGELEVDHGAGDTEPAEGTHEAEVIETTEDALRLAVRAGDREESVVIWKEDLPQSLQSVGSVFEIEMRAGQAVKVRSRGEESWQRL